MRNSNKKAVNLLLNLGFEWVYLQQHGRWDTYTYFRDYRIKSKDIAGVADGIACKNGVLFLIQVKTNSNSGFEKLLEFCKNYSLKGILINIRPRRKAVIQKTYSP